MDHKIRKAKQSRGPWNITSSENYTHVHIHICCMFASLQALFRDVRSSLSIAHKQLNDDDGDDDGASTKRDSRLQNCIDECLMEN